MKQIFIRLYVAAAMIQLFSVATENHMADLVSKYTLMPLLMLHIWFNADKKSIWFKPFLAALFFCWAGDAFLMYVEKNDQYFLFGLASFLIGHILYIVAFIKASHQSSNARLKNIWYLIPVVYAGALIGLLFSHLADMTVPVLIYATAITIMLMAAMRRFGKTNAASFWIILAGAKLFVISDSLIAINKFYTAFSQASLMIMATYVIAQYLIATGILYHDKTADA